MDLLSARASLRAAARLHPRAFRGRPVGRAALGPVASSSTSRSERASSRRAGSSSSRDDARDDANDERRRDRERRRRGRDARDDTEARGVRAYVRRVPFVDLYAVLAVSPDASTEEIAASYKRLQKAVHPDVAGAYAETAAALLNEARAVLVRRADRDAHDADRAEWLRRGGTDRDLFSTRHAEPLSAWRSDRRRSSPNETTSDLDVDVSKGVFVDESQCIGCVQCATAAPNTFRIETRFGRARVVDQWADGPERVADAVETCPVRCIHLVDAVADLPILERVAARLWKERGLFGSGISAKRASGNDDASPFEVADALRRRADPETGLAPWPSRRRRAVLNRFELDGGGVRRRDAGAARDARGGDVDTSSAAAAVAAAVCAANAAEAAAAETSDWRAGSFEEPSAGADASGGTPDGAFETRTLARVSAEPGVVAAPVPSGPTRGDPGPGRKNNAVSAASRREVARLHALLRDARTSASSGTSASVARDPRATNDHDHDRDLFWKAPDEKARAELRGEELAFEASEDGDFAPSEWIGKVRKSRGRERVRTTKKSHDAKALRSYSAALEDVPATEEEEAAATLPRPLALLATALFLAALSGAEFATEPTEPADVVVVGTESGVSATGGWVGRTSRTPVVRAPKTQQQVIGSRAGEMACAAAAWYAALGVLAETADAAARRRRE